MTNKFINHDFQELSKDRYNLEFINYDFQALSKDRFNLDVDIDISNAIYNKVLRLEAPLLKSSNVDVDYIKNQEESIIDKKYYKLIIIYMAKIINMIKQELAPDNIKINYISLDYCAVKHISPKKIICKFSGVYYDGRV